MIGPRIGPTMHVGTRLVTPGGSATDIVSITYDGGNDMTMITTAAPHGLSVNDQIVVSGNSNANYNTTHTVQVVGSPTTISTTGVSYDADGTGGTWALV